MEDPIRITLWGKIVPEKKGGAVTIIRSQSVFPSELELLKAVNFSHRTNTAIQISSPLGFSTVQKLSFQIAEFFAELTFCQEGYSPSGGIFCSEHNFHFGGCLGCHICNDFYEK